MTPYRDRLLWVDSKPSADREQLTLYGLMMAVGIIPVIVAIYEHTALGADATIGLVMAATGCAGACQQLRWDRGRARDNRRPPP